MTDPIEQIFELDAKTDALEGVVIAASEYVAALEEVLAESDLIAVADKEEVSVLPILDFTHELPPKYATDIEVQAALDAAMPGARLGQRCNLGPVTDTFVNGGNYAAGQSRWTQIPSFKTATEEVELIKASFA